MPAVPPGHERVLGTKLKACAALLVAGVLAFFALRPPPDAPPPAAVEPRAAAGELAEEPDAPALDLPEARPAEPRARTTPW